MIPTKTGAAHGPGVVLPEPKVLIDFNQPPFWSILTPDQTRAMGRSVRRLAWYGQERGFSCRMADVADVMGWLLH